MNKAEASTSECTVGAGPKPLLSIITVVLNDLEGLRRTQASLQNLDLPYEWIVIDGASTDGTLEWFQYQLGPSVQIVSEHDYGIYDAMNKGWRLARGEWVYFINAGDMLRRGLATLLIPDPEVDVLSGRVELVDENTQPLGRTHPAAGAPREGLFATNCIAHQATILRRDLIDRCGAYSVHYRIQGDYEYWVRLQRSGVRFHFIDDILARFAYDGVSSKRSNFLLAEAERRAVLCEYGLLTPTHALWWRLKTTVMFHLKSVALAVLPSRVQKLLRTVSTKGTAS